MVRNASFLALLLASNLIACSTAEVQAPEGADEESNENALVDVSHTPVEDQSIGNCWIYAKASWTESMHLRATGESFDVSQSYWTYWDWFDKITSGSSSYLETKKDSAGKTTVSVSTGGSWDVSNNLIRKYGVVSEVDFAPDDAVTEMSYVQELAEEAINASLTSGVLSTSSARKNKKLVRSELNNAFMLSATVVASMNQVFGESTERNFSQTSAPSTSGTPFINAKAFQVAYPRLSKSTVSETKTTLSEAMNSWVSVSYPSSTSSRRALQIRAQKALHASAPVAISWKVDFNALDRISTSPTYGSFNMKTLLGKGTVGSQGSHQTVLEDYEVKLPDGTTLEAGITLDPVADKSKFDSALLTTSEIVFLRTKNSWGSTYYPTEGKAGYHDLYMDYLNGPIDWCNSDRSSCTTKTTPLTAFVLPPGF